MEALDDDSTREINANVSDLESSAAPAYSDGSKTNDSAMKCSIEPRPSLAASESISNSLGN